VQIRIIKVSLTIDLNANKFGYFQEFNWIVIIWSKIHKKGERGSY
jgi:hypothetical protein